MKLAKGDQATARSSLELLYEIGRELASALDLRTLLHRILFLSMKNVRAVSGSIIVLDDTGQPVESAMLVLGKTQHNTTLQLRVTYEKGLAGWVARNQEAVLVPDTSRDERWFHRPDDALERTGPKSAVSAPIMVRDKLVGVVTLVHPKPGYFTDKHLQLVKAIGDQAGIAIINARLYAESQRRAQVMTALAESAAAITASLKLDEVLNRILDQISQALGAEGGLLALLDGEASELEFRAATTRRAQDIIGARLSLGEGIAGWVAQQGQGAVIADAQRDPRFLPEIEQLPGLESKSILCAPIFSGNQIMGVLEVVSSQEGSFDDDDLHILSGIGSMAGTAIRHAQLFESLQAAHRRYHELFEDSIDLIVITDWTGSILEVNRQVESLAGLTIAELRLLPLDHLFTIDREKLGEHYEQLVSGATISFESTLHTRTGREIPLQVYARDIRGEGGAQLQWILRDISERKTLDRLREDLIAMVYHDLRSPLANVVSSLEVLATMLPDEEDAAVRHLLNIALRSTERVQRLTNSLLDINRMEAGQEVGNRAHVSPAELLDDAQEAVLLSARQKELQLSVESKDSLPVVFVDADMIRRVLINLIENAIKFTPPKGKIQVQARHEGSCVLFEVNDSGPGIPAADQQRIFEKFTRLSVPEKSGGLGLGLAFCRLAVIAHGGRIWVESQPGSGSSFRFTIPLTAGPVQEDFVFNA
ncbi:MAG: GAF domain-containing protein [Anaerolineales bacterium]|nr:GAF domain-containing protein [Anaerolineales bacterium]